LEFVHGKLGNGDIYFVDNRSNRDAMVDATFRLTGKQPELWRAETAKSEPVSFKTGDRRTTVPLHLEPWGTVFVVFRKATFKRGCPNRKLNWMAANVSTIPRLTAA